MSAFHRFVDRHKKIWVTVMSVTAIVSLFTGAFGVLHSDLFTVRVVEVLSATGDESEAVDAETKAKVSPPLDAQQILEVAQVPTESTNLFSLKLDGIKKRLLAHPWIKGATISKRFPQTVSITVEYRKPVAILQNGNGSLVYLDADGTPFAPLNLRSDSDLPVLSGFPEDKVIYGIQLLNAWNAQGLGEKFLLSALEWDSERGLQVMATYSLPRSPGRVRIELGDAFSADSEAQLGRLSEVLGYLSQNGVRARQVFADLGKKVVVRIVRGS
jgi:hypothetical protein